MFAKAWINFGYEKIEWMNRLRLSFRTLGSRVGKSSSIFAKDYGMCDIEKLFYSNFSFMVNALASAYNNEHEITLFLLYPNWLM